MSIGSDKHMTEKRIKKKKYIVKMELEDEEDALRK